MKNLGFNFQEFLSAKKILSTKTFHFIDNNEIKKNFEI